MGCDDVALAELFLKDCAGFIFRVFSLKAKVLQLFEMLETPNPTTKCHVAKDLNHQHTHSIAVLACWFHFVCL